ncbi:zinc ABC transporter, periplasmic zinc-binding protein [Pseudooceanicola batsensis HTCC2597]|uniref:High-affinity zinc uptake system protein ZnuA n=1 Tax=Pseudooceanicola batsensis (strain ATCC BAA-863 / DSM 15984 / KCTC 12145 / HTCC2597) TaxID=252305 RepID=A3U257_PSEBH|nr:zinc ABC transporter substrate-binding protein [Pseudooceanicola batsensis]EAQ01657.1 zinc ABC transporter, periplasmic zinc-binding protein [Pseudooceanicola batsensis HTCC2597]
MRPILSLAALALAATAVRADPPRVVTDIPPVHSLVATVMGELGTPELLLPPGGSTHGHQMRPSEAAALSGAELLFWIGPELSPWLEEAADSLARGVTSVPLIAVEGTHLRVIGETDEHDHHDHDTHDHEGHADAHEDEGDHDHEDGHEEDHEHGHGPDDGHDHEDGHDHDDAHDGHGTGGHHTGDGHDHTGVDPHAWLDPRNARIWLPEIAHRLAEADPANADAYRVNAERAMQDLADLSAEIEARLEPLDGGYIVFHDAYGYFSDRFGLPPAGAVSDSEATAPGARRIADLRREAEEEDIRCLFTEPQFDGRIAQRLAEELDVTVGVLDPVGSTFDPGPALYGEMLRAMAGSIAECLAE